MLFALFCVSLRHTLNEQYSVDFLLFESPLLSPWSEVSVAQHILLSSDVYSIRTEDIFALEELSFNETGREKTPIFVDARQLLIQ